MEKDAKVIIISSVSGGGKTTIAHLLKKRFPELFLSITATTRSPRGQEEHGKDYYFYSLETFLQKIKQEEFLEYAKVHVNYYGIPAKPLMKKLAEGISVILNIDVQGMQTVKAKLGEDKIIDIFLMPPSNTVWEARLRQRGANSPEQIKQRLENGKKEIEQAIHYKYVITNDILEKTISDIEAILRRIL